MEDWVSVLRYVACALSVAGATGGLAAAAAVIGCVLVGLTDP
ncbi:MAG: hypothetical protein ABIR22_10140 [Candidatus Eisenbacteria bacterium]